ncbi:MAG: response regulator [Flavitalea sp.]
MTTSKTPIILYAEDDTDDQQAFKELIIRMNRKLTTLSFDNGLPLVQYLESIPADGLLPACIVLDINMPVWDGFKTLQTIRLQAKYAQVPIIMFTTSNSNREKDMCFRMGANDFLMKPIKMDDYTLLATKIKALISFKTL